MNSRLLIATVLLTASLGAQQPNVPGRAVMDFNLRSGPPYPITGVDLPVGQPFQLRVAGVANAPFITYQSSLAAGSLSVLGGQIVDIDPLGAFPVLDGLALPAIFSTNASGNFAATVDLAASTPVGLVTAFQTLIADPIAPQGASLTAASEITTSAGVSIISLTIGDDAAQMFDLSAQGMNFGFYGVNHNRIFVGSNGNMTFTSANTDFTPTPTELLAGPPRIATFWTDLVPASGQIQVSFDRSGPVTTMTTAFNNVPTFNAISRHTFSTTLTGAPFNQIDMSFDAFNQASQFTQITGIAGGGNLGGTNQAETDLSAGFISGAANQALFEWFGQPSFPNWPMGRVANPHDLFNRQLTFFPIAADTYFVSQQ